MRISENKYSILVGGNEKAKLDPILFFLIG